MIKILLTLAFFTLSSGLFAQVENKSEVIVADTKENITNKTPDILIPAEDSYNFGKIPQGKPVHHDFVVKNTGTTPLKLNNVQASCGCTTPEWDHDKEIPAGGASTIKVGYNAQAEGPFTKAITITYGESGSKVITIKGEVWKTPASSAPENTGIKELKN